MHLKYCQDTDVYR